MQSSKAGELIKDWWLELNRKFPGVETDEFVIMPNHLHGIIVIGDVGADLRVGPTGAHIGAPLQGQRLGVAASTALPAIVQWFKTMTTNEYIRRVKTLGWPMVQGQLWQRSYYDHVIRDVDSLDRIRQYIVDNPARWAIDRENPDVAAVRPTPRARA
jgi:REP element-mobilizing transposase RayT